MCECGCGNIIGQMRFPAPNGDVYILDTYPGCDDCHTAAGVTLYRFTRKEAREWGVDATEEIIVDNMGTAVSVLDKDTLKAAMLKWLGSTGEPVDCEVEGSIEYGLDVCFRAAAVATVDEWEKRDRRRRQGEG